MNIYFKKYLVKVCSIEFFSTIIVLLISEIIMAQDVSFNSIPDWISNAMGQYATGLGVADINQDGWDDIVVANGNDMARQPVYVYYNNGDGSFPKTPSWQSDDIDYHGHLSVGDINSDGLPDVVVSVFLGIGHFDEPGYVKAYINQGNAFEKLPSYKTADTMCTFSCALGDADGDGDLDLAVAGGQPYTIGIGPYKTYGRIYYNENGELQTLPGWKSDVSMGALDVEFADMDRNGYLDLIFACHLTPNYIFLANSKGSISETPAWKSLDENYFANSITIATITADKYPDIVISDNDQLGGHGKFKAYFFSAAPSGKTNPNWLSDTGGYGSAVLATDLDGNDKPELLAGRWWGKMLIYSYLGNTFETNVSWSSNTNSVIEAFAARDLDQDGRKIITDEIIIEVDSSHVIYLSKMNVEKILSVKLNGLLLSSNIDYCTIPGAQWISINPTLRNSDIVEVEYITSNDLDVVITNWDSGKGNYIFYNNREHSKVQSYNLGNTYFDISCYPNPFNQQCKFQIQSSNNGQVIIKLYDITGRLINEIKQNKYDNNKCNLIWYGDSYDGQYVASGIYFYHITDGTNSKVGKLTLIR